MHKISRLIPIALFALSFPGNSEEFQTIGIETLESEKLDEIVIQKYTYIGQCPGVEYSKVSGYFVDYDNMPSKDLRIKITNFGKGLSPTNPPYTDRSYDKGRASEVIDMSIGRKHENRFFALRKGLNPLKYKIYNNVSKIPLKEGTLIFKVSVIESTYRRDASWNKYAGKYTCY